MFEAPCVQQSGQKCLSHGNIKGTIRGKTRFSLRKEVTEMGQDCDIQMLEILFRKQGYISLSTICEGGWSHNNLDLGRELAHGGRIVYS